MFTPRTCQVTCIQNEKSSCEEAASSGRSSSRYKEFIVKTENCASFSLTIKTVKSMCSLEHKLFRGLGFSSCRQAVRHTGRLTVHFELK